MKFSFSGAIWQDNTEVVQHGWLIKNSVLCGDKVSDYKDRVMESLLCKAVWIPLSHTWMNLSSLPNEIRN